MDAPTQDITVTIKNRRPIELLDLTESFVGLAREFEAFTSREHPEDAAADVKLYVQEVKSGSVIAVLAAMSPQLLQGLSYVNTVISFTTFLGKAVAYLAGKSEDKPEMSKETLTNISKIVEPIAKDAGSQLNVGAVYGNVFFNVSSQEANALQNQVRRLLTESEEAASSKLHTQVLLHWFQARKDAGSKSGDRGIIESIASHPVKVVCVNDKIKTEMVLSDENPFKEAFIVDVVVETLKGRPALYKIIAVHERFVPD